MMRSYWAKSLRALLRLVAIATTWPCFGDSGEPLIDPIFEGLRNRVFLDTFEELGFPEDKLPEIYIFEIADQRVIVTLVVTNHGEASWYSSLGGGAIGAGERPEIRKLVNELMSSLPAFDSMLRPMKIVPLPKARWVNFSVRKVEGLRSLSVLESEMEPSHQLWKLFLHSHELFEAIESRPQR